MKFDFYSGRVIILWYSIMTSRVGIGSVKLRVSVGLLRSAGMRSLCRAVMA